MPLPSPLITAAQLLQALQQHPSPVILDCSFDLADTQAGERTHAEAHIPGARYLHLDRDLSGPHDASGPIQGGRHPLPSRELWAQRVANWGIQPDTPVVCYDRQGGPYAARAWWMLRWLGHTLVTVLDGGLAAWQANGGAVQSAPAAGTRLPAGAADAPYPLGELTMPTVHADALQSALGAITVVDARAPERYRGDVEPLDKRAGHIPGARNRFFKDNLTADGVFRPAGELRAAFEPWAHQPAAVVHQCGSGVTACHNLLAMEIAGLHGSCLYPGSWSEWSADPMRPIAVG